VEVVASLSQGRTAAAQCGLFTHKSVPVIFEPPCIRRNFVSVISANIVALKDIITGQIFSNLTLFSSPNLSLRRFIAEITLSAENSGGIFRLWIEVFWFPLPVWIWLTF